MAANTQTVTNNNPTPPTNLSSVGSMPPNPTQYQSTVYGTDLHYPPNPASSPIYYDDGVANTYPVISQNEGGGVNGTTNPSPVGTLTSFAAAHAAIATGGAALTSNPHEGAGTEVLVTLSVPNPSPAGQLKMVSCGPVLTPGVLPNPNQLAASTLSPATNPTLSTISPTTSVHGTAAITMTATGVGFIRTSVIYIGGVAQVTTFVSSTSLTCLATPGATAGSTPVTVVTGGVVTTTAQTWTFS